MMKRGVRGVVLVQITQDDSEEENSSGGSSSSSGEEGKKKQQKEGGDSRGVDEGGSVSSDDDEEEKWPGKGYKELIAVEASASDVTKSVAEKVLKKLLGVSKLPDADAVRTIGHNIGTVNYNYPSCCLF